MGIKKELERTHRLLAEAGIAHALIGAMALASAGYVRATNDVDYLVDGDEQASVRKLFLANGFTVFHQSSESLQLSGPIPVDIIFANRPLSKSILQHAATNLFNGIPCACAEDIIGLKIQAYSNNPKRKLRDLADIQALVGVNTALDWTRIKSYADLFGAWPEIEALKGV